VELNAIEFPVLDVRFFAAMFGLVFSLDTNASAL
jgi:hypothetical protein